MISTHDDRDVIHKVTSLMEYLAELTDRTDKDPMLDIRDGEKNGDLELIWLRELPEGVAISENAKDGVVLRMLPPRVLDEPAPPSELDGWVDQIAPRGVDGPEPRLLESGPTTVRTDDRTPPPNHIVRRFTPWQGSWRRWAAAQRNAYRRRDLYQRLEWMAKRLEQHDDDREAVLATGLVAWNTPDGRIYRHLITESAAVTIERGSAEIRVVLRGGRRRVEDRVLFGSRDDFHPERAGDGRSALSEDFDGPFDSALAGAVRTWLSTVLDVAPTGTDARPMDIGAVPLVCAAPALIMRPRSRVLVAEAYRKIAADLKRPDATTPMSLANLVVDGATAAKSDRCDVGWVDSLGADPLFPLPTNEAQDDVMRRLRSQSCVVVQGPPGTGKTHTIANLMSALLAEGRRVLVTSQKEQALKVLRDKIPSDLRRLCVLLAGGSRDAANELENGIRALSDAVTRSDAARTRKRIADLTERRADVRQRIACLENEILELRGAEATKHPPVVPGYSGDAYRGTLVEIVREVRDREAEYGWMPAVPADAADTPTITADEVSALLSLIASDSPHRRLRVGQYVPRASDLVDRAELEKAVTAEQDAKRAVDNDDRDVRQLAHLGEDRLAALSHLAREAAEHADRLVSMMDGLSDSSWVSRAVADHLGPAEGGLWTGLHDLRDSVAEHREKLERIDDVDVDLSFFDNDGVGALRRLRGPARDLLVHMRDSGWIRRTLPSAARRNAEEFLAAVTVDGRPPDTVDRIEAALRRIEIQTGLAALVERWNEVGVPVAPGTPRNMLADLALHHRVIEDVRALSGVADRIAVLLSRAAIHMPIKSIEHARGLGDKVVQAIRQLELDRARRRVDDIHRRLRELAAHGPACPELAMLADAARDRDLRRYREALALLATVESEKRAEMKRLSLSDRLAVLHPELLELLRRTPSDSEWETRLADLGGAWAWSKARRFVEAARTIDEEKRLTIERDELDVRLSQVTADLAAEKAMDACVAGIDDDGARALQRYRQSMADVGAGTGRAAKRFRRAARESMERAKTVVPSWVVPLPHLLENLSVDQNSFDVVIVDEASQVGIESLFLLWMAPQVIVVGDDRQCTPNGARAGDLEKAFREMGDRLMDISHDRRMQLTPKANLYGLASLATGKEGVIALREHFRCMPEIIRWSSDQFYGGEDGLVSLRERTADDLDPLKVVEISDGYTEGRDSRIHNPVEVKRIVRTMRECIADPRYDGKTFGVVVLRADGMQTRLLEQAIADAIPVKERERRRIRVGIATDFQGDERDIVFLSMVDVRGRGGTRSARTYQQSFNVAASRARDQMWLFTSLVAADLKPVDLRRSLIEYMTCRPSTYGPSLDLDAVSATSPHERFESLFEQRVFREIRARGFHVVPQYPVGAYRLDLVVVGDGGRIAVECDGAHWHSSEEDRASDARRDRELRRMGWEVRRIRESEYEASPERELNPLWTRLAERGIHPRPDAEPTSLTWRPAEISFEKEEEDNDDES